MTATPANRPASPPASQSAPPATGRRSWIRRNRSIIAALAVLVAIGVIIGAPGTNPPALDPSSTKPDGTKALVLLLQALGAHVHTGVVSPPSGSGVALLFEDHLDDHDRGALLTWIDAGGILVTTDPTSPLSGVAPDESTQDSILGATGLLHDTNCALPAVQQATSLDPAGGATLLEAGPRQVGCYPAGHGDFLVARSQGSGTVVVIGGPDLWENANLAQADNSVLAASLLAPVPGTEVTVVGSSPVGGGDQGLLALISPRLIEAWWGLVASFFLIVLWRARRLGRPVPDVIPVELPASGLVEATANLLQEGGRRGHAAALLRADLRRVVADRLGVDPGLPPEVVAEVAAARTGVAADRFLAALDGPPPATDNDLLALAQAVEAIRLEVISAR
jgi:hypothetical protein